MDWQVSCFSQTCMHKVCANLIKNPRPCKTFRNYFVILHKSNQSYLKHDTANITSIINTLLSIIIPVYNVQHTLHDCVASVLAVCSDDVQVVLVDDGSPDGSPAICDEWAARDTRVEVVHRANGGLSAARNSGIDVARGEWITFVDSDDVWGDMSAVVGSLLGYDGCDMIEYPVRRHYATARELLLEWGDKTYRSPREYWTATQGWTHSYAWNKFYRRRLFDGVRYPEGRVFEDIWTTPLLLTKARAVHTVSQGWYGYRDNPSGITMTAGGRQLTDLLEGNMHAARVMGVCDVRHYAAMVNIQIDVYRLCRSLLLQDKRFAWRDMKTLTPQQMLKLLMPLDVLCRIMSFLH